MLAIEMKMRLKELHAEQQLASFEGFAADGPYMADLNDEITQVTHAYIGAAVTEIAVLRAELSGPQVG
jgi:hypothetical protein